MQISIGRRFSALRFWPKKRSDRRILRDLVVIFGGAAILRLATFNLDLFERIETFTRAHEDWQLDELFVTLIIVGLAFVGFGVRRIQDQRRELALRVAAEQHATMLALQDPLTGLPNRRRFYEVLSTTISEGGHAALMILDLDGFKQINDLYGHASGDEALRVIAQKLRSISRNGTVGARLGGDEFAIVSREATTPAAAQAVAEWLIAAIASPVLLAGVEHRIGVSIGITEIAADSRSADELLRRADVALYRAKEARGSTWFLYEAGMDADLAERIKLEMDLRQALAAGQIVPNYQPIVNLKTGEIIKFEALARWQHPVRGAVAPSIFIPLAEHRGMIAELTESILRQACNDARAWPANMIVSVNLSPMLLHAPAFGLRILAILAEEHFPPSRLEVEITERALETDFDDVESFLNNLRSAGIRIALDDFGADYSSLSRLKRLPFDSLKIDQSFVQSMMEGEDRALFVRTILQLGRGLGMTVTAEGIEATEQRDGLIAEGCTQGQGYLFSPAVPAERTQLLLVATRAEVARSSG